MFFLLLSFLAGVITVLAPCVLPVLPVIVGGSISNESKRNPYVITAALAIAVVVFTLILKVSTIFINVPERTWGIISGLIIIGFGLITFFPNLWEKISLQTGLSGGSGLLLAASARHTHLAGDILLGLALGPVFSSCSPTYFLILATILPRNFALGLADLVAYAVGLSLTLLLFSLLGQRLVRRVRTFADPNGWFKRGLGLIFIITGLFIVSGVNTSVQTYILEHGYFDVTKIEMFFLQKQ